MEEFLRELDKRFITVSTKLLEAVKDALEFVKKIEVNKLSDYENKLAQIDAVRNALSEINLVYDYDYVRNALLLEEGDKNDAVVSQISDNIQDLFAEVDSIKVQVENERRELNSTREKEFTEKNIPYLQKTNAIKHLSKFSSQVDTMAGDYGLRISTLKPSNEFISSLDVVPECKKVGRKLMKIEKSNISLSKLKELPLFAKILLLVVPAIIVRTPLAILPAFILGFYLVSIQFRNIEEFNLVYEAVVLLHFMNDEVLGKNTDELDLVKVEVSDEELESMPEVIKISEQIDSLLEEQDRLLASTADTSALLELERIKQQVMSSCAKVQLEYIDKFNSIKKSIEDYYKEVEEEFAKAKDSWKPFGKRYTYDYVRSTKYTLGMYTEFDEEVLDIGNKNIIIRPNGNEELEQYFIRCLVANILAQVKPGNVKIHFLDPNNLSSAIMPFYCNDIKTMLIDHKDNSKELLDALTDIAQENLKLLAGDSIVDYNKMAQEQQQIPISYHVVFILSQPKAVEDDEALRKFFEYSCDVGIQMIMVSSSFSAKNAYMFMKPFDGVASTIISLGVSDCHDVRDSFLEAYKATPRDSLSFKRFMEVVIPEDRIWTESADQFIKMYPGFKNGDPKQANAFTVGGEGDVHGIVVGMTGAGKSVLLNFLIVSLGYLYSPDTLELWLCDFKCVEFVKYMASEETPFRLPHVKACLCTTDPDYATSLFAALNDELKHRSGLYSSMGVSNMKNYNNKIRAKAKETGDNSILQQLHRRILLIIDEFPVIFQEVDSDQRQSITKAITQVAKLGRALGIHMIFATQTLAGTISDDVLSQFTLRYALRVDDSSLSQQLIGSPMAAEITQRNGLVIPKNNAMKKPEDLACYKTPFIADDDNAKDPNGWSEVQRNIKAINDLAIERHVKFQDVITYNQEDTYDISYLYDAFKTVKENNKMPSKGTLLFMGYPMTFTYNKIPDNIILTRQSGNNMLCVFRDYEDIVHFYNQIIACVKENSTDNLILANCQINELSDLMQLEDTVTPRFKDLCSISCAETVDYLSQVVEYRASLEDSSECPTAFVFLIGWDKGIGFGLDPDPTMKKELGRICAIAPLHGIHICIIQPMIGTTIPTSVNDLCSIRIAGACSQDDAIAVMRNKKPSLPQPSSLENGWFYRKVNGEMRRTKLFLSEIKGSIQESSIEVL